MAPRNLESIIRPNGVVVVGGSDHPGTIGRTVIDNLVAGGFGAPIYAVNIRRISHPDANWVESVEDLPYPLDFAVICTPAETVPHLVSDLGKRGTKVALILSGGLSRESGLSQQMLAAARASGIRIIGPNSVGLQLPHSHLNASFERGCAAPGGLALISQSGAIATGLIDWAAKAGIGFSAVVSSGDAADIDMADLIDFFAADTNTRAILLHLEGISDAQRFLAAARAASRVKPVIALKAGRGEAAAKAALTHTGALAGSYDIYQAAFRRAGIVMVDSLTELFSVADMLNLTPRCGGNRLGIVTNGGGAAILALDAMAAAGVATAPLDPHTLAELDKQLPCGWSHNNPVDILGDADAERYRIAIEIVAADPAVDAILVLNCPIGLVCGDDVSRSVSEALAQTRKPRLACWLGGANFDQASSDFAEADVPLFNMPEDAVRGFGHLLQAERAREASRTVTGVRHKMDLTLARAIITTARAAGRTMLSEPEAQQLLATFAIPTVPARVVATPSAIIDACAELDPPYAVKIVSPDGIHKSDIGGVALNLGNAREAQIAAEAMAKRIARDHPDVATTGFVVEAMIERAHSHELVVGIADDPTFGLVIMVGAGGKAVEILHDRAFGLPPLDARLARDMIDQTRIAKLLHGYRDEPPAQLEAVADVLRALSAIAIELPEVRELDINPLLVDASGVVALDARIRISDRADAGLAVGQLPRHEGAIPGSPRVPLDSRRGRLGALAD